MIKDNESFNNTVSENSVLEELREKIPNYFRSNVYDEEGNLIELGGLTLKNLIIILKIHSHCLVQVIL